MARYIDYLTNNQKRSANTVRAYGQDLSALNIYLVNRKIFYVKDVKLSHLRDFIAFTEGISLTKARKQTAIKSFFKYMYEEEVIVNNPADKLRAITLEHKDPQFLSQAQFNNLIEVIQFASPCYMERDLALINILAKSGLRRAEIISLNVDDVDLTQNRIRVKRKGGNTTHMIIHKELATDIRRYLLTIDRSGNKPLFISRQNQRMEASTIWHIIKKYAEQAGLNNQVTVHSLRHTFATLLLRKGVSLSSIQKLMNHKSIETTSRYLHLLDEEVEREFNSISFEEAVA